MLSEERMNAPPPRFLSTGNPVIMIDEPQKWVKTIITVQAFFTISMKNTI